MIQIKSFTPKYSPTPYPKRFTASPDNDTRRFRKRACNRKKKLFIPLGGGYFYRLLQPAIAAGSVNTTIQYSAIAYFQLR